MSTPAVGDKQLAQHTASLVGQGEPRLDHRVLTPGLLSSRAAGGQGVVVEDSEHLDPVACRDLFRFSGSSGSA